MRPLPRAKYGTTVALDADVYNEIVDTLQRLDNLRVASPLRLQNTPGGPLLSWQPPMSDAVLVAILGNAAGAGAYDASILYGDDTGVEELSPGEVTFPQPPGSPFGSGPGNGPAPITDSSGNFIVNAVVVNLFEQYFPDHVLTMTNTAPIFTIGHVRGQTNENPPRKIVYVENWPVRPVVAQIVEAAGPSYGGIYSGKIIFGEFMNGQTALQSLLNNVPIGVPAEPNCWIINNWAQTSGVGGGNLTSPPLSPGMVVFGFISGMPYATTLGARGGYFFTVYTCTPPQISATTINPITTYASAGPTYGTTEQDMLNSIVTDLNNLQASLSQLYGNLQGGGYSE